MKRRAELRPPRSVSSFHAAPATAAKIAGQFCDEMLDNLRHNVGEQKKRFSNKF
jgi:hypothetical protein